MLKVGVVGCGAIGTTLCKAITRGNIEGVKLVSVFDKHITQSEALAESLHCTPEVETPQQMAEHVDLIIECASTRAVPEVATTALTNGCSVMIMSVGALTDNTLREKLVALAKKHKSKIYIPSGAVVGIDGIKAANIAGINRITLKTRKPPESLKDAPYVQEKNIKLANIKKETLIFTGNVDEAIAAFPANINVAAILSLAAGPEKSNIQVEIYADPSLKRNIHEITVEGSFGRFTATIENVPSPTNPKTSYLAALSAIATLKQITNPLQTGT
jgi:aspartate dehydrogenase